MEGCAGLLPAKLTTVVCFGTYSWASETERPHRSMNTGTNSVFFAIIIGVLLIVAQFRLGAEHEEGDLNKTIRMFRLNNFVEIQVTSSYIIFILPLIYLKPYPLHA